MTVEIREATPADVGELGSICYDAFYDIATKHGFPPDFPSVEFAQSVIGMMVRMETIYNAAAFDGARPLGSAHLQLWDEAAGIGPVSVDVSAQGQGAGRALMEDLIAYAHAAGFDRLRLLQDAFNMQSLALYTSVGFVVQEPVAYLTLAEDAPTASGTRPATPADFDAMGALCREVYGIGRRNEIEALAGLGMPMLVHDTGRITGYLIATAMGHGVAETDDSLLALIAAMGAMSPGATVHIPMRQGELYRRALAAGHRNRKVMNLMSHGPYEAPTGPWVCSVFL